MSFRCTATVHHGTYHQKVTGTGVDRGTALAVAVSEVNAGYRPSAANVESALQLLVAPDQPLPGTTMSKGGAYIGTDDDGYPVIDIGWVHFEWTQSPRLWQVTAQVEVRQPPSRGWVNGWNLSRQVPTFYLDPSVQGIISEAGAVKVAEDILSSAGPVDAEGVTLHVSVTPVF